MAIVMNRYLRTIPAMPAVQIRVAQALEPHCVDRIVALVDTGADQTLLTLEILEKVKAPVSGRATALTYDDHPRQVEVYHVKLQLHDFTAFELPVLGADLKYPVIGRDVLNEFRIVFDGRRQIIEISEQ